MMDLLAAAVHPIVHVNAALNATAALLLVLGMVLIRRRHETAHKRVMLSAFAVSIVFLVCYLWYHYNAGHVTFTRTGPVRTAYYTILATHVVLAMTVPFLAIATIYLGFRATGCCRKPKVSAESQDVELRYRRKHRQLARWTYPIWMYVSVTGVIVYVMLYHLWPPGRE
jgi:uncharacterized membrane protein YozB (DUF420 family)